MQDRFTLVEAVEDKRVRMPKGQGGSDTIMNEGTKRTLKRVIDIVIAVLTALITTISAHAAGIVR